MKLNILYIVLIFLISIGLALPLYFLLKKVQPKVKSIILKCLSIILLLVSSYIYLSKNAAIESVIGLNMYSPFKDDIASTITGLLLVWFTYAAMFMLVLYPFFKVNNIKNVIKFFALPVLLLDASLFTIYGISVVGVTAFDKFDVRILLMSIELIIAISYILAEFIRKDYFKITKKEIITLLITIVPIVMVVMPPYAIAAIFGLVKNVQVDVEKFTLPHRMALYLSIIIPLCIYYALRDKDYATKKFTLTYMALGFLWSFLIRYKFSSWTQGISNWPLHLCHTAMFIVPLCLVFNLKKVYYFTFFINVMGAFFAMTMPDISGSNPVSENNIIFWLNHYSDFFMPVLIIALKIFERPKFKEWVYAMITFVIYFITVIIVNGIYGTDFFYINGDFITDKLGDWAEHTRDIQITLNMFGKSVTVYPVYQAIFFGCYCMFTLAIWFVYDHLYQVWDLGEDMRIRNKEYKKIKKELKFLWKGKDEYMPISGDSRPCLELKKFSKKYGSNKIYAVKDASLKVNGGEIFGFLGPNGAGKSTIIKSVVGIQTITGGSIEVCGYDVAKQSVQAKKQIGFVPDHYALYENLTGREYINYIADLYEVSKEDRDNRIEKYLTNFNLHEAFDNQMKTYSHGMKQKIAIMSALVHNPKVWILDEPLTGLDPTSIYQVKEAMKEHAKEGNIVFFSSHIIDVVERICDRIAIIKKGNILTDVKVKDLEKQNINLEDFYLETINAELIEEYANKEPVSEIDVDDADLKDDKQVDNKNKQHATKTTSKSKSTKTKTTTKKQAATKKQTVKSSGNKEERSTTKNKQHATSGSSSKKPVTKKKTTKESEDK